MDWVTAGGGIAATAAPGQGGRGDILASDKDGTLGKPAGSYDAIRVYLWLGMASPETPGVQESLTGIAGMAAYMKSHPAPPRRMDEKGTVVEADGPVGFSGAVVPYLHSLSMKKEEKSQMDRMAAMYDSARGIYGRDGMYYDQNLVLFAKGWTEERLRFDRQGRLKVQWR
jgi:endoglucanase